MLIAYVLYPVKVLGPGNRIGIWVYGCKKCCPGCLSPELQVFDKTKDIPVDDLLKHIEKIMQTKRVDGITISGGEPFEQADELFRLVSGLEEKISDILIYSGKKIDELYKDEISRKVLKKISVLIDGEYMDEKNQNHPLKGSENQKICFLNHSYQMIYEQYIAENIGHDRSQIFELSEGEFVVGIRKHGFHVKSLSENVGGFHGK